MEDRRPMGREGGLASRRGGGEGAISQTDGVKDSPGLATAPEGHLAAQRMVTVAPRWGRGRRAVRQLLKTTNFGIAERKLECSRVNETWERRREINVASNKGAGGFEISSKTEVRAGDGARRSINKGDAVWRKGGAQCGAVILV